MNDFLSEEEQCLVDSYVWQSKEDGGFVIIDICPKCGKRAIVKCKHNSCYNNQCECGYLTGFIGRNHAN